MAIRITELWTYPIKSFKGISLQKAELTETGMAYDRYWMLVSPDGKFVTQRDIPELVLFEVSLHNDDVQVNYREEQVKIPKCLTEKRSITCTVWKNEIEAWKEPDEISAWFTKILKRDLFLVRKADTPRLTKRHEDAPINFPDSNQYLVLGEEAMKNLNGKLEESISADRFRANVIFSGGQAHDEDTWSKVKIGEATFDITKPCSRCNVTTINQQTAEMGAEPLKTLAQYRLIEKKVLFGQYMKLVKGTGSFIQVGDTISMD